MVKKIKVGDLVYVEWGDHCSFDYNQWRSRSAVEELGVQTLQSVGWVVRNDKECLAIAAHCHGSDGSITGEMSIMRNSVTKLERIVEKDYVLK